MLALVMLLHFDKAGLFWMTLYRFLDAQSFGAIQVVELKPGGETINVTQANKRGGFIVPVIGFDVTYMCKALLSVGGYGMFVSVLEVLPCYTVSIFRGACDLI